MGVAQCRLDKNSGRIEIYVKSKMSTLKTLLVLALSASLHAQDTTFSTNVRVVNLFASVHDDQGRPIHNLTKDDFTLEEDGRRPFAISRRKPDCL